MNIDDLLTLVDGFDRQQNPLTPQQALAREIDEARSAVFGWEPEQFKVMGCEVKVLPSQPFPALMVAATPFDPLRYVVLADDEPDPTGRPAGPADSSGSGGQRDA